jgi:signal recognition particle subunit SEC65
MKCLKNVKTNEIVRVDDKTAYQMAGATWSYIPKSEWKAGRPVVTEKQVEEAEKKEVTVSEKALKRKKLKEKQREADGIDNYLMKA